MPFRFSIPLPGPFSYSRRIGGRRRPRPAGGVGPGTRAVGAGLDRLTDRIDAWGQEGARRQQARRVEQGLPPVPAPPAPRETVPFREMVAQRRRRLRGER